MNQPTREEFNRLEAEQKQLKEKVRKLEQQQTEPINVRVERGLSLGEETMLKTIMDMVGKQATDIGVLKGQVTALEQKMEKRFDVIAEDTKKRFDAIAQVQQLILDRLPKQE